MHVQLVLVLVPVPVALVVRRSTCKLLSSISKRRLNRTNSTTTLLLQVLELPISGEMSNKLGSAVDVIVLSNVDVEHLKYEDNSGSRIPVIDPYEVEKDSMDLFNHPRERRSLILSALLDYVQQNEKNISSASITFVLVKHRESRSAMESIKDVYENVHSRGLIDFLVSAWNRWADLGDDGRDPSGYLSESMGIPPLIPSCFPLPREPHQNPSNHVLGQVGYYNTDTTTPIFNDLLREILDDTALVQKSVDYVTSSDTFLSVVYIIPTHPGHHSAFDSFGGYCYVNHAAACADLLKRKLQKVAILDIDYHCGNGTASIFYDDPTVLVVSIHCHPDYEYPFHTGFSEQTGSNDAVGTTLHLPLLPGAKWIEAYKIALESALAKIRSFNANALVVSMGLDTYDQDPCAIRRAGFCLEGEDYVRVGETIATGLSSPLPTVFIQEGGYRMEKIGKAAVDVVTGYATVRRSFLS